MSLQQCNLNRNSRKSSGCDQNKMMIKVALELLFMAIVSAALVFELGQLNAKIGRFA